MDRQEVIRIALEERMKPLEEIHAFRMRFVPMFEEFRKAREDLDELRRELFRLRMAELERWF